MTDRSEYAEEMAREEHEQLMVDLDREDRGGLR